MADYDFDSLLDPQVDTLADTAVDPVESVKPGGYDFDSLLDHRDMAENIHTGQSLLAAAQENPDRAARGAELGDQYGIEHGAATANLDSLEVRAKEEADLEILSQNPALKAWAMSPGNLDVAHDDLENLSWMERMLDTTQRLASGLTTVPGMGGLGTGQMLEAAADRLIDLTGATFTGERPPGPISSRLKDFGRTWQAYGEDIRPDREPDAIGDVAEALGQLAGQVGLSVIPGGMAISTTAFAGMGYNMAYERAKQSGADEKTAQGAGALGAVATSVSERLGIDFLIRKIPRAAREKWVRGVADVLMSGGVEAIEEYVEGVLHNAIALNLYDPEAKVWTTDGREEQAAGFAAGIFRTLMHGVTRGKSLGTPEDAQREQQDMIRALGDSAQASKLLKRLPAKYKEFVEHAKKQGDIQDVFIPANQFVEYFQQATPGTMEQVLAAIPGLNEQLVASMAENKDLAIPLEDYATHLAGTEHHAGLAPDIRLHEGDMTEREAVSRQGDLEAEADAVHQDVVDRLVAAGVEPEQAQIDAETHRAYFRSMGDMFDVSPMEMYQDVGLQIQGEDGPITVDQEGFSYNQDGELQRTPAFDAWFGESKVVDEGGEPQVVYHGTDAEFDAFDKGTQSGGALGAGFYFAEDESVAESAGEEVMRVHLSVKNPLTLSNLTEEQRASWNDLFERDPAGARDKAIGQGFDGILDDVYTDRNWVVFDPNQIKAIHNQNPTQDPRIMYQGSPDSLPESVKAYREEQEARPIVDFIQEPLLNKDGNYRKNANGDVTGAPEGVKTSDQVQEVIGRNVSRMEDPLAQMPASSEWYEVSGDAIRGVTHGDPKLMEDMVRLMAVLSATNQVGGNATGAIRAIHQLAAGDVAAAGRFPNKFKEISGQILAAEDMSLAVPGVNDKVMSFYQNLWDATFLSEKYEHAATMDMWMARLYGYNLDTFSAAQYRFANYVTQQVGEQYNAAHGTNLKPRQIQAALWAYARNREKFGDSIGADIALDERMAFDTYIDRAKQHITVEAVPSVDSGLFPEILDAPIEAREQYTKDALQLLLDEDGQNGLFRRLGMPLYESSEGSGSFEGRVNPNEILSVVSQKIGGKVDATKADAAAKALAYIYTQDGVPWFQLDPTLSGGNRGVAVRFSEQPSQEAQEAFMAHVQEFVDGADFTRIGNDLFLLNYTTVTNAKFIKAITAAANTYNGPQADLIQEIGTDVKAKGNYIAQDWGDEQKAVAELEGFFSEGGRSDLLPWLRSRREAVGRLQADYRDQLGETFYQSGNPEAAGRSSEGTGRVDTPPVRENGTVQLTHWGRTGQLQELDPAYHGQGLSGLERRRKAEDTANFIPRTYFGIATGQAGGYSKERGLGPHRYTVPMPPDRLYDFQEDTKGLLDKAKDWVYENAGHEISVYERMIHEAGYAGYWTNNNSLGMVAAVFEPTNPESYVDETAPQRNPVAPFDTNPMYGQTQVVPTGSILGAEKAHAGDRAIGYLDDAATGKGDLRRAPSVRDNGDGTYTVIDGRSAVTAAQYHGYSEVPVRVIDRRTYTNKDTGEVTEPHLDDPEMDAKLEEMYATNGRIKDKFDKAVESIARQLGGYPLLTTLKGRDSTVRKINDKYDGDPDRMSDLLRATIILSDVTQVAEANRLIQEAFEEITVSEGVLLGDKPFPGGYSDGKYNMRLKDKQGNAIIAELQMNVSEMLVAKERLGHALYEDLRLLPKGHPLSATITAASEKHYALAMEMHRDTTERSHGEVVAELDAYGDLLMEEMASQADISPLTNSKKLKKDSLDWLDRAPLNTSTGTADRGVPSSANRNASSPSGETAAGTPSSNTKVQSSGISDGLANGNLVDINNTSTSSVSQFGDGVTLNQGERGSIQFKDGKAIISLFESADRSTFLHESGHLFLQTTAKLVQREDAPQQLKDDWKAIHKYLGVKPGQKLTTEQHETFARSFEAYLREGVAPSPRLRTAFQRFSDWLMEVYSEAGRLNVKVSPEIRAVFDRMLTTEADRSGSRQPGNPTNGIRSGIMDRMDAYRFQVQDKLIDLKRQQQAIAGESGPLTDSRDAYQKAAIWEGRAGERLADFNDRRTQPLLEKMAETGLDLGQVGEWLVARHAREANAYLAEINPNKVGHERYRLSGMSNPEAAAILEKSADNAALQEVGQMIDQINREKVLSMVRVGLISEHDAGLWQGRYEHYVPLKREEAEISDRLPSRGQGYSVSGKESKMRTGSAYWTPTKIVTNVLAQAEATMVREEKTRVGQALLRLVEDNPQPGFWHIDTERTTTSVRNGEVVEGVKFTAADNEFVVKRGGEEFIIVFDPSNNRAMRMVSGLKNLQAPQLNGAMKVFSSVNRFLSQINTSWNPEFIISNFARDIQTAAYNLSDTEIQDMTMRLMRDVPAAMGGIRSSLFGDGSAEWSAHWEDFRKHGGKTGWIDLHMDLNEHEQELTKMMERVADGKPPKALLKRALDKIDDMNTVVENGTRLAAYKNALDAGLSKDRAAELAKDLTLNFNRKGNAGPTLNALYMFYNASVQGSVRLMQAMVHSKKGRRLAYATVAFAVTLDMMNRALSGDDDDGENLYDALPDYVKDHNLIIMGSDGPIVKIPLPWGYNVLHSMGQVIGESISKRHFNPAHGAQRVAGSVITAFNPVGAGTFLQTASPTVLDPFVMMGENKNFAGIPLKPEHTYDSKTPKPEYQMHWKSSRESSKAVTKWLNDNTGGNEVRPGAINVSPEWVDVLVDTVSGGAGRTAANSVDTLQRIIQGKDIPSKNVPFLRRLTGFDSEYGVTSRYYEWTKDVAYAKQELKKLRGAKRALAMENPAFALVDPYTAVEKTLRRLRKAKRNSTDEARIEEINQEIRREMAGFNRKYSTMVLDAD